MSSLEYQDLCRLCLVKDDVSVPIFEDVGDIHQICNKITTCLPVKVTKEDKLPQKLCNNCVYKVESFYQFWHQTLNVEKQLLQWLENAEKQGYSVGTVFNQSGMKDQSNENRLVGNVMQQVSIHQSNMNMDMDNMGVCMPMMMTGNNQQQITSVPMDTSGSSIQNIQAITGSNTQATHDQITQTQTNTSTQQEEEDESSEDEENSDDECDGDDGLPIKEESEEDPNNSRTIEPTTFVNVSLACEDPGPSGLQQQKMADIQEMAQATDVDPKTGWSSANDDAAAAMKDAARCDALTWNRVMSIGIEQVEHIVGQSSSAERIDRPAAAKTRRNRVTSCAASQLRKEKISCDFCKITFSMRGSEYRKHMLKHSSHRAFQCDVCKKKFKHKINMNRHKAKVHGEAPLYSCQYCDFSTIHCSYLQVHFTRKHTDDFHFSCDKCDRKFRVKADYTKHLITHEGDPCICDVCGSALANRMSLYFHKNYKHRVKDAKFQCPVCKKKLQTQKNLDSHVLQHEQRYMCEECGVELTRKASLKKHIKTHSGEKPYLCHICGKTFASATGRKVHLLTHAEVRPYVCTICGQSFTQRPALSVHWKKKHPDVTEAPPPVSIKNIIESITHRHDAKTQ